MYEVRFDQKVQGTIDSRRRSAFSLFAQRVEDIVSTDRFMTVPDQLKNPPPDAREAESALPAYIFRGDQGLLDAVTMIVLGYWERACCRH